MTNLIALIDGSAYSESVCDHVAWAASRLKASVQVVHVIGRRDMKSEPANLSGSIGLGARTALLEELAELDAQKSKLTQRRGRLLLEEAVERLSQAGVTETDTKLRNGDVVDAVAETEKDADLIVVGAGGLSRVQADQALSDRLRRRHQRHEGRRSCSA